jgi:hypothetical protein
VICTFFGGTPHERGIETAVSDISFFTLFRNLYQISDVLETGERATNGQRSWKEITPFIFRTGSTSPPLLLRTTPEQNFLSRGFRITGLVLMSIAIAACSISGCWVFVHRHDRVVRAAQPFALHLICFGSFVMAWSILPLSFDESYGWTEEQLSKGCMSVPWLVSTGFITTYGALFVKVRCLNQYFVVMPFLLILNSVSLCL